MSNENFGSKGVYDKSIGSKRVSKGNIGSKRVSKGNIGSKRVSNKSMNLHVEKRKIFPTIMVRTGFRDPLLLRFRFNNNQHRPGVG